MELRAFVAQWMRSVSAECPALRGRIPSASLSSWPCSLGSSVETTLQPSTRLENWFAYFARGSQIGILTAIHLWHLIKHLRQHDGLMRVIAIWDAPWSDNWINAFLSWVNMFISLLMLVNDVAFRFFGLLFSPRWICLSFATSQQGFFWHLTRTSPLFQQIWFPHLLTQGMFLSSGGGCFVTSPPHSVRWTSLLDESCGRFVQPCCLERLSVSAARRVSFILTRSLSFLILCSHSPCGCGLSVTQCRTFHDCYRTFLRYHFFVIQISTLLRVSVRSASVGCLLSAGRNVASFVLCRSCSGTALILLLGMTPRTAPRATCGPLHWARTCLPVPRHRTATSSPTLDSRSGRASGPAPCAPPCGGCAGSQQVVQLTWFSLCISPRHHSTRKTNWSHPLRPQRLPQEFVWTEELKAQTRCIFVSKIDHRQVKKLTSPIHVTSRSRSVWSYGQLHPTYNFRIFVNSDLKTSISRICDPRIIVFNVPELVTAALRKICHVPLLERPAHEFTWSVQQLYPIGLQNLLATCRSDTSVLSNLQSSSQYGRPYVFVQCRNFLSDVVDVSVWKTKWSHVFDRWCRSHLMSMTKYLKTLRNKKIVDEDREIARDGSSRIFEFCSVSETKERRSRRTKDS